MYPLGAGIGDSLQRAHAHSQYKRPIAGNASSYLMNAPELRFNEARHSFDTVESLYGGEVVRRREVDDDRPLNKAHSTHVRRTYFGIPLLAYQGFARLLAPSAQGASNLVTDTTKLELAIPELMFRNTRNIDTDIR
ncbi:hypothetical protein EVAR_52028_1 [Eumeta japonica]|uniref:Uncharacterized protein n=1 Tax=Eumeta variegata TaxID=151549 RepID=A0A4C1YWH0_EUMVA|nr:hypothetical protein EVAR_52028_1 [Eumeta japonica]